MDPQLFELLTSRLDKQDTCLERIETKLDQTRANTTAIGYLKWILGGAWAGLLALLGLNLHQK